MYYLEFNEMVPVLMCMDPEGPVYRELMIEALESKKTINPDDIERKIKELGIKYDLLQDVDEDY